MTAPLTSTIPPLLLSQIQAWFERETRQHLINTTVLSVEHRNCSTVYQLQMKSADHCQKVVCKQIIDDEQNRLYRHRGNAAQNEFEALLAIDQGMKLIDDYGVPVPRAVFAESDSFLMDFVSGTSAEDYVPAVRVTTGKAAIETALTVFYRIGVWLRHFQSLDHCLRDDKTVLDETLAHCDDRLRMIDDERDAAIPPKFRSDTLRKIERWWRKIQRPILVGNCHGDFGPWNQIVDDQRLTVIDFFAYRQDCLLTDPLTMLVYLESQSHAPSFSPRRVRQLQSAFVQGLAFESVAEPELLAVCEAQQRIRRIHDCVRQRPKRWSDRYRLTRILRQNVNWFSSDFAPLTLDDKRSFENHAI